MAGQISGDPYQAGHTMALRLLERRARTSTEVRDALQKKGVPPDVADALVLRLTEVGLLNDEQFAHAWVQSRQRSKARSVLARELRQRGVADEYIADATAELSTADEEAVAAELVRRKMRSMARLDGATRTRRLVAMLARRGYSATTAFRVVREVVDDDAE